MEDSIGNSGNQESLGLKTEYLDPRMESEFNDLFGDRKPLPGFRCGHLIAQPSKQSSKEKAAIEVAFDGYVVTVSAFLSPDFTTARITISIAEGDKEPECIFDKPVA